MASSFPHIFCNLSGFFWSNMFVKKTLFQENHSIRICTGTPVVYYNPKMGKEVKNGIRTVEKRYDDSNEGKR